VVPICVKEGPGPKLPAQHKSPQDDSNPSPSAASLSLTTPKFTSSSMASSRRQQQQCDVHFTVCFPRSDRETVWLLVARFVRDPLTVLSISFIFLFGWTGPWRPDTVIRSHSLSLPLPASVNRSHRAHPTALLRYSPRTTSRARSTAAATTADLQGPVDHRHAARSSSSPSSIPL
jgi:hypothetical protein